MPTRAYTRSDLWPQTSIFIYSHLDRTRPIVLKIWSCSLSNEQDQIAKPRTTKQQSDRRKITASVLMVFVLIATLFSKQWNAFATFIPVKNFVCFSLRAIIKVIVKKRARWIETKIQMRKKLHCFLKMEVWMVTTSNVKQQIPEHLLQRPSLKLHPHLEEIKGRNRFGYDQCDIELLRSWTPKWLFSLQFSKKNLVSKNDKGVLMKI